MGSVGQDNEKNDSDPSAYGNEFDGDDVDDDLVFSTVPQRSTMSNNAQIHFDEIDDDEMRRFAESLEQEEHDTENDRQGPDDDEAEEIDDDRLCEDYAKKMQTPTKSAQIESNKRKKRCLEDIDALLDDDEGSNDCKTGSNMGSHEQVSPVFKKKS